MKKPVLCIVGLGYVGLPLAHIFAKKGYEVLGYDLSTERIAELNAGRDWTKELTERELKEVMLDLSADPKVIARADIVILAIPTPVDERNNPDLEPMKSASRTVGKHMKKGAIVVYESTVWPGTTEEICEPILAEESGMECGTDFKLGYSPERVNPGDKEHTIEKIKKIVSGQDAETLNILANLYGSVIEAGIHRAANIKVAEMAKAIENAQRDLNIAFINEIALLCHKVGIETKDVLEAAATKWNFLKFVPGLVGGHCIGVDPYYLVEKARQLGMKTQVITAGRALNDSMSCHVAEQVAASLRGCGDHPRVLVLGITFKENIPDTRNSKSGDVVKHLEKLGCSVEVHDPYVPAELIAKRGMKAGSLASGPYDAVVLLVPHREYMTNPADLTKALKPHGLIYDLKSLLPRRELEERGVRYKAL